MKTIDVPEDLKKEIEKWMENAAAIEKGLDYFANRKCINDRAFWALIMEALPETKDYVMRYDHKKHELIMLFKKKDLDKDDEVSGP